MPLAVAFTVVFFGYVGYRALLHEGSSAAEQAVQEQIDTDVTAAASQYGLQRAALAIKEYRKGIKEETKGCNCGPDIDKYTQGTQTRWAPSFASWVANETGTPLYSEVTKSWRIESSRNFLDYLKENGTWYPRDQILGDRLKPEVGDYIVYQRGSFEDKMGHVDIVVRIDGNNSASLVGGNIKDRLVYRENFPYLQHHGFLGFGRPNPPVQQ